jgi:hypothetical protein
MPPQSRWVNFVRLLTAGLTLACVAVFSWAWSGCAGSDRPSAAREHEGAASDATVCIAGGSACSQTADCCSLLCVGGQCADPSPAVPQVCDADSGTYLGHRPVQGQPCMTEGLVCELGESPVVLCDTLATCKDGAWQLSAPDLTDPACAPASGSCPSSLDALDGSVGEPCTALDVHCDYAGRRCECAQNAPVPGWPETWMCQPPPLVDPSGTEVCPTPRPRIGTACPIADVSCDYGACQIRGGSQQGCEPFDLAAVDLGALGSGRWVELPIDCACPATAPAPNTPCTRLSVTCEYGSSPVAECDTIAQCNPPLPGVAMTGATWGDGTWMVSAPGGGPPCAAEPAGGCPASGQPIQGMACDSPSLDCDYSDRRCECASGPTPGAVSTWRCTDPILAGPGCGPRARLGTPCPQDGVVCDYGSCEVAGGTAEVCQGIWMPSAPDPPCQIPACPPSVPLPGAPCALGGPCEYGASNVSVCDTIAVCRFVGLELPSDGGPLVPPPPPLPPPPATDGMVVPLLPPPDLPQNIGEWTLGNPDGGDSCQTLDPSRCPPSFDTVPRGAGCAGAPSYCDYPLGRCRCAAAEASPGPIWSCQDPAPLCPQPRPRLGSACAQEGLVCAYGACGSTDGDTEICRSAVWLPIVLDCSLDAGSLSGPIDGALE